MKKINLLNFDRSSLIDFFKSLNEKPFRADQVFKWIHQSGVANFASMTNLSLAFREYLIANTEIALPKIVGKKKSIDGTEKWLLQLEDNNFIETVFIPEEDRGTLCISTQVGCPLNCAFCATGNMGFKRNLTTAEIIGQLWLAVRELTANKNTKSHIITNVVIMGMGEPLLNFDNVVKTIKIMLDTLAYGLSKRRVTLSTVGLVPELQRLSAITDIAVAISLHAPNDALRNQLIPINAKYPLAQLIPACKNYYQDTRRKVTIEYAMIAGVNDSEVQAKQLVKLLSYVPCKINLIPMNACANNTFRAPSQETIDKFRKILMNAGFNTITRKTRGSDIAASCGQLAAQFPMLP